MPKNIRQFISLFAFIEAIVVASPSNAQTVGDWTVSNLAVSSTSVKQGSPVTISFSVRAARSASKVSLSVPIANPSGTRIYTRSYSDQSYSSGQTRSYSFSYTIPTTAIVGSYKTSVTVKVDGTTKMTSSSIDFNVVAATTSPSPTPVPTASPSPTPVASPAPTPAPTADACAGNPARGTTCASGTIYAGVYNAKKYMITPSGCDYNTDAQCTGVRDYAMGYWVDAVAYCQNMVFGGFSDWRLPNKEELAHVWCHADVQKDNANNYSSHQYDFVNKCSSYGGVSYALKGFDGVMYWTSVSASTTTAWVQHFDTLGGEQKAWYKDVSYPRIRCVRNY